LQLHLTRGNPAFHIAYATAQGVLKLSQVMLLDRTDGDFSLSAS